MRPHKSAFQLKTLLNFLPFLPSVNETQDYLRIIHLSLNNDDNGEDNHHAQLVSDNHDNDDDLNPNPSRRDNNNGDYEL